MQLHMHLRPGLKHIGGVFAGGLYNRTDSRSWDSASLVQTATLWHLRNALYRHSPMTALCRLFGSSSDAMTTRFGGDELSPFNYKSHGWLGQWKPVTPIPLNETGTKDQIS